MLLENYLENFYEIKDNEVRVFGVKPIMIKIVNDVKSVVGWKYIKFLSSTMHIPRRTLHGWLSASSPIPIPKLFTLFKIWEKVCGKTDLNVAELWDSTFLISNGFSVARGKKITLPKELTPNLAYFVGYIIGDGCLVDIKKFKKRTGNYKYVIEIASDTKAFAENILNRLCEGLFGLKPKIYNTNSKCFEVFIQSKVLFLYLNRLFEIPMGKKKGKLHVPQLISHAPKKIRLAFFAGLFDADGTIFEKDKLISITQADKNFLTEVQKLVNELGLETRSIIKSVKKEGITYNFSIRSKSLKKFLESINFYHPNRIYRSSKLLELL